LKTFRHRTSILSPGQKALWPRLAATKRLGCTLYGGTAIALRLGHRRSVDFDFFTDRSLDKGALVDWLSRAAALEVLLERSDTLVVSASPRGAKSPVKVSFFGSMGIGRFGDPELTADRVLRVASMDDLMATKLKVLFDRAESKDYEDLAAMIGAGADLSRGLGIARAMLAGFNPQVALTAMTYHKDLPGLSAKAKRTLIKAATAVRSLPEARRISQSLSDS
jgi:hypothetical protein